jgi:PIN domain nuclease of toxin-antitoxin system
MKVLIDTHVFIWWTNEPARLSPSVYTLLTDTTTEPMLSMVSIWEMQIKISLGKLALKSPLPELVEDEIERNKFQLMSIELSHIYAVASLPLYHRDPFDRLLIAQASVEKLSILSIDEVFDAYGVDRLW